MYNYYADLIWHINAALAVALVLTIAIIFFAAAFLDHLWRRHQQGLLALKKNVYTLILAGEKAPDAASVRAIAAATPRQFIDIETSRGGDTIFFNESEKRLFRKYFINPKQVARLEKIARRVRKKGRKIEAILALGYTGVPSALDTLSKLLLHPDKDVVYFTIIALGQIRTPRAAELLINVLHRDPASRYKIASLMERFPPSAFASVAALTNDPDPFFRSWAAALLAKSASERYVASLEKLTADTVPEVRATACVALGAIGAKAAAPALVRCLADDHWQVKTNAITALERLLGDAALPEVIGLIRNASWSVNGAVRDVMTKHITSALPFIEQFLFDNDEVVRLYSVQALESSGCLKGLLHEAAGTGATARTTRLIEGVMRSGHYAGIEAALIIFDPASREKVLTFLATIDGEIAGMIGAKVEDQMRGA